LYTIHNFSFDSHQRKTQQLTKMLFPTPILTLFAIALSLSLTALAAPVEYHMFPRVMVRSDHLEVLSMRASTAVNPAAVTSTTCLDSSK
jgi:hypothetical protein